MERDEMLRAIHSALEKADAKALSLVYHFLKGLTTPK